MPSTRAGLRFIAFICLQLILVWAVMAYAKATPVDLTPQQLVLRYLKADSLYSYIGSQATTLKNGQSQSTRVLDVYHKKPNKFRYEYERLSDSGKRIIIQDGRFQWVMDSNANFISQEESPDFNLQTVQWAKKWDLLRANYNMSLAGIDTVAGRQAGIVLFSPKLLPKNQQNPCIQKVWIDIDTGIALRTEEYGPSGSTPNSITYFTYLAIVDKMDGDLFVPKLPRGSQIITTIRPRAVKSIAKLAEEAKKNLRVPVKLPFGFEFESGSFYNKDGQSFITLRYTDGIEEVSVYQTFPPSGIKTTVDSGSSPRSYRTSTGFSDFTILCDLDTDSLVKIAEAIVGRPNSETNGSKPVPDRLKKIWNILGLPTDSSN